MTDRINILVIDDSEDDRLLYKRTLHRIFKEACYLAEADNGDDGLACIDEQEPACVLLDYSLPGRNGIEVLKRIHSMHPFVPVIMLTGQGNEKVAVAAMKHGAQNYITKSNITPETLEHVIRMGMEHCMMQRRIHEQRTSLEVFTRALAHDLKEPARTVRSFVEMLDHYEELSDKGRLYLQHIQRASDRMLMLIDTVFLYTRLDAPGQMARESCDTGKILQEVRDNLAQLVHERNTTITASSMPTLHANHTQVMQLLQNLICNAINHSEKPVNIRIRVSAQSDYWQFCVSDNGPGIEQAYIQKIFEPFKRLTGGENQGSGLGLAICRKIVESHGGKIWCESTPKEGTRFIFTLPREMPVSKEDKRVLMEINNMRVNRQGQTEQPLANILLVDDSRDDIEMTKFRLLERSHLHCNLLVARDGEEALATLRSRALDNTQIDLVLLDINMPEMDGFELLEHMQKDEKLKQTHVIMCTGSIYDKDMERAKSLGAAGYITKPIDFSKLKSIIEQNPSLLLSPYDEGFMLTRAA
jgi:CheY-like chemotaxis protein